MPHYKNGREAKIGDSVAFTDWQGKIKIGILTALFPGATTCNGTVEKTVGGESVTLADAYHAEDVALVEKPKEGGETS